MHIGLCMNELASCLCTIASDSPLPSIPSLYCVSATDMGDVLNSQDPTLLELTQLPERGLAVYMPLCLRANLVGWLRLRRALFRFGMNFRRRIQARDSMREKRRLSDHAWERGAVWLIAASDSDVV